jgi:hypothetical protein
MKLPPTRQTPRLTKEQREEAASITAATLAKIQAAAKGDPGLFYAFVQKIGGTILYVNRDRAIDRGKMRRLKFQKQDGLCGMCDQRLTLKGSNLHRFYAPNGYSSENTVLLHPGCHNRHHKQEKYR